MEGAELAESSSMVAMRAVNSDFDSPPSSPSHRHVISPQSKMRVSNDAISKLTLTSADIPVTDAPFKAHGSLLDGCPATATGASQRKRPFVIGCTGGTASGKTTVCTKIVDSLESKNVQIISMDCFYKGLTAEEQIMAENAQYNFDHPSAFDYAEMVRCLDMIRNCIPCDVPTYDFCTHSRGKEVINVPIVDVIILEGILIFHDPDVRALCDLKIFVELDSDIRLLRRLKRDVAERGRDVAGILEQYENHVKPSHDQFVEPTKMFADIVIPRGPENEVAIDLITQHVKTKLFEEDLQKTYPRIGLTGPRRQVQALLTFLRDRESERSQFCFHADRLSRLVVEEGLAHLPFTEKYVQTPLNLQYLGLEFCTDLCGVSIVRAGETMEAALRQVIHGIKVGKVLIDNGRLEYNEGGCADSTGRRGAGEKEGPGFGEYRVVYSKLPKDIDQRFVLLMDPVIGQGWTATKAIEHLLDSGVLEERIIFLNIVCSPTGVHNICGRFPKLHLVTCSIDKGLTTDKLVYPGVGNFGDRYFGTDFDRVDTPKNTLPHEDFSLTRQDSGTTL